VRAAAQLGRRSFDIFLYHYLFLIPILQFRHHPWTSRLPLLDGQLVLMAAAIPIAVAGSILTARAVTGLRLSFGRWLALHAPADGPRLSLDQRAAD
jgi:peptidoglycan/LPS O-acetylase OafA/YrhL